VSHLDDVVEHAVFELGMPRLRKERQGTEQKKPGGGGEGALDVDHGRWFSVGFILSQSVVTGG
jgi:hypothetical protein